MIYLITVCISLVFNWCMQFGYYLIAKHKNKHAFEGQKTLLAYTSGYIGDAIVLPIMNCFIVYLFLTYGIHLTQTEYIVIGIIGLTSDILLHFFHGHLKLTNWSMPQPFSWNFAGKWHMFSFFFQISFVYLFFYWFIKNFSYVSIRNAHATYAVFGCVIVFLLLFLFDYLLAKHDYKNWIIRFRDEYIYPLLRHLGVILLLYTAPES